MKTLSANARFTVLHYPTGAQRTGDREREIAVADPAPENKTAGDTMDAGCDAREPR
jgi:hypothetical protein